MHSLSSNHSKPPSSLGPQLQRWAARLALLVACAASVATSRLESPEVRAEYKGPPLTLRTDAPTARASFRVQVSADKYASKTQNVELRLMAYLNARWRPDEPGASSSPLLRARLILSTHPQYTYWSPPQRFVDQKLETAAFEDSSSECSLNQVCEWEASFEIELDPNGASGTVDIEWVAEASATIVDTDEAPEGFSVKILEP